MVLKSFESFLTHAVASLWSPKDHSEPSSSSLVTPTWYLSSSFTSLSAFGAFDTLLQPSSTRSGVNSSQSDDTRVWVPEVTEEGYGESFVGQFPLAFETCSSSWSLNDLTDIAAAVTLLQEGKARSGTDAEIACVAVRFMTSILKHCFLTILQHLARTLHSTLVSTFLDCAPAVFSPSASPPETELQMVIVVCRICRCLYGRLLQDSAEVRLSLHCNVFCTHSLVCSRGHHTKPRKPSCKPSSPISLRPSHLP